MYNNLIEIGPVTIHGYGLMIAIGILAAVFMACKRARRFDADENIIYGLGFTTLIFGFIGARLLFCIIEFRLIISQPILILSGDGFVVYGGIIGGVLAAIVYCRHRKVSFLKYFDLLAPSVALAQGFGRIGCFLAGCCYGRETDSAIGIVFHNSSFAPNGVRLVPTQLISSAGNFSIALMLILYAGRVRSDGKTGALYLILYSVGRFLLEFLRNDTRGSVGALSTSQFISVFMLAVGITLYFRDRLGWTSKKLLPGGEN